MLYQALTQVDPKVGQIFLACVFFENFTAAKRKTGKEMVKILMLYQRLTQVDPEGGEENGEAGCRSGSFGLNLVWIVDMVSV